MIAFKRRKFVGWLLLSCKNTGGIQWLSISHVMLSLDERMRDAIDSSMHPYGAMKLKGAEEYRNSASILNLFVKRLLLLLFPFQ